MATAAIRVRLDQQPQRAHEFVLADRLAAGRRREPAAFKRRGQVRRHAREYRGRATIATAPAANDRLAAEAGSPPREWLY